MKARLIANPASGTNRAPDLLPHINEKLRELADDVDIVLTTGPGDAARAAQQAAQEGYELLFVGGGDGTLNEVINGVADCGCSLAGLTIGILPLGTGNDFATGLDVPEDPLQAIELYQQGRTLSVDLGTLAQRSFVNVSAGGFIAEVSDATDPTLKTIAGKLAYLIGGAKVLLDFEPVRAELKLQLEDDRNERHSFDMQMFAVCNSRLIGGGKPIAPEALIDDGLLDLCLIEARPLPEFIGVLSKIAGGEHLAEPRVHYFRIKAAEMEFSRTIKVNTDGEVLELRQAQYGLQPAALRFLCGADPFSVTCRQRAA